MRKNRIWIICGMVGALFSMLNIVFSKNALLIGTMILFEISCLDISKMKNHLFHLMNEAGDLAFDETEKIERIANDKFLAC